MTTLSLSLKMQLINQVCIHISQYHNSYLFYCIYKQEGNLLVMLQGVQNGSVVIYLIRFVIHFIRTMKEVISTYIGTMDKDI